MLQYRSARPEQIFHFRDGIVIPLRYLHEDLQSNKLMETVIYKVEFQERHKDQILSIALNTDG